MLQMPSLAFHCFDVEFKIIDINKKANKLDLH